MVNQFTYGVISPVMAFGFSFLGSVLGLGSMIRARRASSSRRRARWLVYAALAFGLAGIWLMHFMAILGVTVASAPMRYDVPRTVASAIMAVTAVLAGVFLIGYGRRSVWRVLLAGTITGCGVAAMHHTGTAAFVFPGTVSYDRNRYAVTVLVAVLACMMVFRFALAVRSRRAMVAAGAVMASALTAMHYTGMAGMHVHVNPAAATGAGVTAINLLVPIVLVTMVALLALVFSAMHTASAEDFALAVPMAPVTAHVPPVRETVVVAPRTTDR